MKRLLTATAMALALAACSGADDTTEIETTEVGTVETVDTTPRLGTFGIALENRDESVDPGENFYEYVNGTWLKTTQMPSDRSRYGAFTVLADEAEENVRTIIEAAASKENPSADEKRIGDLFAAFTDTDAIEARGLEPIATDLALIREADSRDDILHLMSQPELGLDAPLAPFVWIDAKDNDNYIVYLTQSGLGLPNRDYYFLEDERSVGIREAYVGFLTDALAAAGETENLEARAQAIMDFETALADGHWTPVERRDRDKTYNKMTRAELLELAGPMNVALMLEETGLDAQESFVVREPSAIATGAEVFSETDIATLRDYLTKELLVANSAYLPSAIDTLVFDFYGKTLNGQEEQRERWKRGVQEVNGTLGELVGKVYVGEHFPPASKAQMQDLIENLRAAFKDGIDNLDWMDDATKEQAQYKLAKFRPKIGYPDEFETYDGLTIDRDDLMATVKSARRWGFQDELSKLGGPIDREEWGMTPQTVNAYYNPSLNEIVFPAAILQAPFFDPNADAAVNYGAIGAVIGHEMGHGFDDQGRKSDGDGVQRDWWTPEDAEKYEARAKALADQYSEFEPLPGEFLNGELGLGENIGDLTGVTMAYDAYKRSLNGEEAPVIDGLTGDQRFFMAWAQVWPILWTDESLSAQIKNGPHSPGEFRTNGIVRNLDQWYEAFGITEDDAMYLPPEERVKIW